MARGDGGFYQPKDRPTWYCYVPRRKAKRAVRGPFRTEAEARKAWKDLRREVVGGKYHGPEQDRLTVGDLLDTYLASLETRHRNKSGSHEWNVKALREAWGSVKASELTVSMVDAVRTKWLAEGLSEATTDRYLQALRAAYVLAVKQERVARRPQFDLINPNNRREGFVDEDSFWKVHVGMPQLHGDVTVFAYRSAWRRDEIESLTWEQVDMKAREARLWDSKNGEARVLPLEAELWEAIERRAGLRRFETSSGPALSMYVFHENGKPLGDWRKRWDRACRGAGMPGLLFHDLRRSAIKNMVDAGIPQVTIMAISGHRSDAVFRRYAIRTTKETRKAIQATVRHVRGEG